jgi:hypothetical protein
LIAYNFFIHPLFWVYEIVVVKKKRIGYPLEIKKNQNPRGDPKNGNEQGSRNSPDAGGRKAGEALAGKARNVGRRRSQESGRAGKGDDQYDGMPDDGKCAEDEGTRRDGLQQARRELWAHDEIGRNSRETIANADGVSDTVARILSLCREPNGVIRASSCGPRRGTSR